MTKGGSFGRGAAHASARRTGASYDDASCEEWSRGTPLPYPVKPAWLRAHKRALAMRWPIENVFELGLRYPLTRLPYTREWIYFSYELHWSRHLIEIVAENVDSPAPRCVCGATLSMRPPLSVERAVGPFLFAHRVDCPSCGARFDPKCTSSRIRDDETGHTRSIPGGGFYRFALVVDCGKSIPESGITPAIEPELVALCERIVGGGFHQIGVVY
jgi:hypothetical protein